MASLKALAAAAFVPALALFGLAQPAAAQGASDKLCKVTIDRTQTAGTYDVTRQVFEDGNCICYVYTGPKPQADSIESAITELLGAKKCPDARVQQIAGPMPVAGALAGTTGTGVGTAGVIGGVAAAGAVAAVAADGSGSP
jgi:hypothetical protein